MANKVFLWTAPRCVSTAFERSIMELPRIKVFHEPYSEAYYYGPDRKSKRFVHQECNPNATYQNITKKLESEYEGKEIIFVKDMAYYVEGYFQEFLSNDNASFQHTFLIRTPKKSIPSLYKGSVELKLTGFNYFDPQEAGFKAMYDLYTFLKANLERPPIVVDADDLLDDPEGIMRSYCHATGLPFDVRMLTWEATGFKEWEIWGGWHEEAMKSTGFRPRDKVKEKLNRDKIDISSFPSEVQDSIRNSIEYYTELYEHRIKAISS